MLCLCRCLLVFQELVVQLIDLQREILILFQKLSVKICSSLARVARIVHLLQLQVGIGALFLMHHRFRRLRATRGGYVLHLEGMVVASVLWVALREKDLPLLHALVG